MNSRAWMLCGLLINLIACGSFTKQTPAAGVPGIKSSLGQPYLVLKGDTLYSIAWRLGFDYRELAQLNAIGSPYTIYPGQSLRVQRAPKIEPKALIVSKAMDGGDATVNAAPPSMANPITTKLSWHWPLQGQIVEPFDADHQGIRIQSLDQMWARAAADGTVVYSGDGLKTYGNLVLIRHSARYLSAYGLTRTLYVKEGATVKAGDIIAELGGSRQLHFEIRLDGAPINPRELLP